ncbi:MAG: YchF family ATPase [Desulfobacterales bacterium]|nr:YchF family ATPase [Desulfobacterales bacterium]MCK5420149.1 YchF family ATPase [Desulfobacterales bacterium]
MRLGIIGLPRSGKSTIFDALTKNIAGTEHKGEDRIAVIRVPNDRLGALSQMYNPKKTTYAQVEYFLPGYKKDSPKDQSIWTSVRNCDALLHVVRNHAAYGFEKPSPLEDFIKLDQEFILSDLVVAEKRLERIELDRQRGNTIDNEEQALLDECRATLENEIPIRKRSDLASARKLRGFTFLSAKPVVVVFNNEDDNDRLPDVKELTSKEACLVVRGKLEQELAQMPPEEAAEFLAEFNIPASAMDRVIQQSYALLELISFFTVISNEVRAWTLKRKTPALDAADVIHSDMKKGFIRAEVVSFQDLMDAGSYAEAKKRGTVRLEGKTYEVQEGDIIQFRFNV